MKFESLVELEIRVKILLFGVKFLKFQEKQIQGMRWEERFGGCKQEFPYVNHTYLHNLWNSQQIWQVNKQSRRGELRTESTFRVGISTNTLWAPITNKKSHNRLIGEMKTNTFNHPYTLQKIIEPQEQQPNSVHLWMNLYKRVWITSF